MDINHWPNSILSAYISPLWQIIFVWLIVLVIMRVKTVGVVFKNYNTLFHELGHAVMSLLFSGQVHKIELNHNAGGVAVTSNKSWLAKFMVSIAGYPAGAIAGWSIFNHLQFINPQYQLYILFGTIAVSLLFWIRNKYGIVWSVLNLLFFAAIWYFNWFSVLKVFVFVMASAVMTESLWSVLILIYISAEDPQNSGDAKNLRDLTYLPSIVWAILLGFIAFYLFNLTLQSVIHWHIPIL